jgi:ribonuclease HI
MQFSANWGSLFHIYTDGSCLGNPGPGGWAFAVIQDKEEPLWESSGGSADTTNNRMEIQAVYEGLKALKGAHAEADSQDPLSVMIFTDSKYVLDSFEKGWIKNWMRNGWKNASKKPVKNKDLWELLYPLVDQIKPRWTWVKGHSGDRFNELVDQLALSAAKQA